jgi:hypothetical protein
MSLTPSSRFLVHEFCDLLDQPGLVDHVGDLGGHDALAVICHRLDLGARAHHDAAAAGHIGLVDARAAQDDAAGGEVRPVDEAHQRLTGGVGVVDQVDGAVDHLAQVVGRDVRGHADRDAAGAVDQEVREPRRQHGGLHQRLVKVGVEIDGLLVDVGHHLHREPGQPRLGVAHGGGAVAIDGAEVALAVHQQAPGGKVLRQAHHRVVDGGVPWG